MQFDGVTYLGPAIDDPEILERLSEPHRDLLRQVNGLVAFAGGLHLRGAVRAPEWHSLRHAWDGPAALHARYHDVRPDDVPFAQDALGDQYLLRDGVVHRLDGETGELEQRPLGLVDFLEAVIAQPMEYLSLEPLQRFWAEGGRLAPGELLSVYPPFCTRETMEGVTMKAVPAEERIGWLAAFAATVRALPDGATVKVEPAE